MIFDQQARSAVAFIPFGSTQAAAYNGRAIDTLTYDYATFDFISGGASSGQTPTSISVQESATSSASFTNITGFVGATAGQDYVIPQTSSGIAFHLIRYNVELPLVERWLRMRVVPRSTGLSVTSGGAFRTANVLYSSICRLTRAKESPFDTTGVNVDVNIIG